MGKMGKKKERDGDGKSEGVKREREREREAGLFRGRRHVENVLPRRSRARAWAYKPREFNTLEMSNVEDKMSSGTVARMSPAIFPRPAPALFYASLISRLQISLTRYLQRYSLTR